MRKREGIKAPKFVSYAMGQGLLCLEASIEICIMVSISRRAGVEDHSGQTNSLCRNLREPKRFQISRQSAEDAMRWYVASVVGLTHSRGVTGVMPGERNIVDSKGSAV